MENNLFTNRFGTFTELEPENGCKGCIALLNAETKKRFPINLCEFLPCISKGHHVSIFKEVTSDT